MRQEASKAGSFHRESPSVMLENEVFCTPGRTANADELLVKVDRAGLFNLVTDKIEDDRSITRKGPEVNANAAKDDGAKRSSRLT